MTNCAHQPEKLVENRVPLCWPIVFQNQPAFFPSQPILVYCRNVLSDNLKYVLYVVNMLFTLSLTALGHANESHFKEW